jgi:hypothetical protein
VAFRIPRGTMIILVALPERTYANDCVVRELTGADAMRISGL